MQFKVNSQVPTSIWVVKKKRKKKVLYRRCAFAAMETIGLFCQLGVYLQSLWHLVLLLGRTPATTNFIAHHVVLYFASAILL